MVHGYAISIVLHVAIGMPYVARDWIFVTDSPPLLVLELQGIEAESQLQPATQHQTMGAESIAEAPPPEPAVQPPPQEEIREEQPPEQDAPPPPPEQVEQDDSALSQDPPPKEEPAAPPLSPPTPAQPPAQSPGAADVIGAQDDRAAQTISQEQLERQLISEYVKQMSKKVQSKLVYPDDSRKSGLQGIATVTFKVLADGSIIPESLKIARGSGQSRLDSSALSTIRASLPFDPPPREMTVSIDVEYARLK